MDRREEIQKAYIRVCKDSGFTFEYIKAAVFVGEMLRISPLEVWTAFGDLRLMERIAKGEHPAAQK